MKTQYLLTGHDISRELDDYEKLLEIMEANNILNPSELVERIGPVARHGDYQVGESLPFQCDHIIKLRQGELSIWSGFNGHGKSQIVLQTMLWQMKSARVLVASLELKAEVSLYRMLCMYAGCRAAEGYAVKTLPQWDQKLFVYDVIGSVSHRRIETLILYAREKLGVNHLVIDSLMKCGIDADDYKAEKRFVDRLQNLAKETGIHIHLVCHARKSQDEEKRPNKFDVIGTSHITNLADNIFIFWRNKAREKALRKQKAGTGLNEKELKIIEEQYDAILAVEKNREGGTEGVIGLYYHSQSGQYGKREGLAMLPPFEYEPEGEQDAATNNS